MSQISQAQSSNLALLGKRAKLNNLFFHNSQVKLKLQIFCLTTRLHHYSSQLPDPCRSLEGVKREISNQYQSMPETSSNHARVFQKEVVVVE